MAITSLFKGILLSAFCQLLVSAATHPDDILALKAFQTAVGSPSALSSWTVNSDPCSAEWSGITCDQSVDTNVTRVVTVILNQLGLATSLLPSELGLMTSLQLLDVSYNPGITGPIPSSFGNMISLTSLNLQYCSISGSIPETLSNLTSLQYLQLNNNLLTGSLPPLLGQLKYLTWLDFSVNQISGSIPVSPGIDELVSLQHFHAFNNSLNGSIPSQLGVLPSLIHFIVDNNQLSGAIPPEIANISILHIFSAENNSLSESIPAAFGNLSSLNQLRLSNNSLTGGLPSVLNNTKLSFLDFSNNPLGGAIPATFGTELILLVSLNLKNCSLTGPLPASIAAMPSLQTLYVSKNSLNGTLPILLGSAPNLLVADLSSNNFTGAIPAPLVIQENITASLAGNPLCTPRDISVTLSSICNEIGASPVIGSSVTGCGSLTCLSGVPNPASILASDSLTCTCVEPLYVFLVLISPPFTIITNSVTAAIGEYMAQQLSLLTSQVQVSAVDNSTVDQSALFVLSFFPSGLNLSIDAALELNITTSLVNHIVPSDPRFGPFSVLSYSLQSKTSSQGHHHAFAAWKITVIALSSVVAILLIALLVMFFVVRRRRSAVDLRTMLEKEIARNFTTRYTLDEVRAATNDFDAKNIVGEGGFGVVYRGVGPDGKSWAVKRSKDRKEDEALFQEEVRAISKLNHVNIVKLLGYCDDEPERIFIYEFCSNGNLAQHLSKRKDSVAPLTFKQRLRIAIQSAEALKYMHTFVMPGLIHRDVKSENIFLDENFQAKVADFGLLKELPKEGGELSENSKHVAGTPGYIDPEYFLTTEVTTKSDVYSFGVVLLELITGKPPILISEETGDRTSLATWATPYIKLKQFDSIVDPQLRTLDGVLDDALGIFSVIAAECVERLSIDRPDMTEVVSRLIAIDMRDMAVRQPSPGEDVDGWEPLLGPDSSFSSKSGANVSFLSGQFVFAARE